MKKVFLFVTLFFIWFYSFGDLYSQTSVTNSGREQIINVTNLPAGTYRYAFSMGMFKHLSMHIQSSGGVTITIWVTNDALASTTSDDKWIDVTSLVTGQSQLVDINGIYFVDSNIYVYKYMIKYVMSDNTNSLKVINIRYN